MTKRSVVYAMAGVPAFCLPASYVALVVWVFIVVVTGRGYTQPTEGSVMWWFAWAGIWGTFIQWPFYIGWALLSPELTIRLRLAWVVGLILLNMFAIPYFLVCKYRRRTRDGMLKLLIRPLRDYLAGDR